GWDTHGLPLDTALTKNKQIDRKKVEITEYRQMCADNAIEQVNHHREQGKSIRARGDCDNPYLTLSNAHEAAHIKVFGEIANRDYIYKGLRPVFWSPSSETALAEAEIEYKDKRSPSIYVTYEITDGKGLINEGAKFIIWTTTPWTLPASLGVSLHPDLK